MQQRKTGVPQLCTGLISAQKVISEAFRRTAASGIHREGSPCAMGRCCKPSHRRRLIGLTLRLVSDEAIRLVLRW
jgi:hypothetical protein